MVVAYAETGKSCAFPCPSPEGRYILLVLADKTTYPVHQRSSDRQLLDLETRKTEKLDIVNSELSEASPAGPRTGAGSASSAPDGTARALPHVAYFDAQGRAHKPFLLPQEDPEGRSCAPTRRPDWRQTQRTSSPSPSAATSTPTGTTGSRSGCATGPSTLCSPSTTPRPSAPCAPCPRRACGFRPMLR